MGKAFEINKHLPLQKARESLEQRREKLKAAAGMYEKHFLREMTKAMRKTITQSEMTKPSQAEKLYRDQLDEQYVDMWGQQGGVGLGDMIYKQLVERFAPGHRSIKQGPGPLPIDKPRAPIQLPNGRDVEMKVLPKGASNDLGMILKFEPLAEATQILAPWDGEVEAHHRGADGLNLLRISHGGKFTSTLGYTGTPFELDKGQKVRAGASLALMAPTSSTLSWRVTQNDLEQG